MRALGRWATPRRCYPGKLGASSVKDAQLGALAHTAGNIGNLPSLI